MEPMGISEYRNSCFPTVLLLRFLVKKKKKVSCGLHPFFKKKINKGTNCTCCGLRAASLISAPLEGERGDSWVTQLSIGGFAPSLSLALSGCAGVGGVYSLIPHSFWWADLHGGPRSREVFREGTGLAWKRHSGHRGWFRTVGGRTGLGGTGYLKHISTEHSLRCLTKPVCVVLSCFSFSPLYAFVVRGNIF